MVKVRLPRRQLRAQATKSGEKIPKQDFLKFLGTAGARFVMIKQLRHSGGIWISSKATNVLIDPGPGSLVCCAKSKPKLDPAKLDGIILTHRHLDHSGDINVMIEAMTEGGFKRRGVVFCPQDTLEGDPVIFKYLRSFPQNFEILTANTNYSVGNFVFQTSMQHIHPVETFGLKFKLQDKSVGLLVDTKYFEELTEFYRTDILIVSVIFLEMRPGIDHLNISDIKNLIQKLKPEKTILTHFGMTMLKAKPHLLAEKLSQELHREVVAAYDGMTVSF
jgi:phosphoribosyl 1,2-cyclic phosphodiesterase